MALLSALVLAAFGSVSRNLLSSVELRLDADRVAATLGGGSAPADRLLNEALRLSVDAEGATELVLIGFRIENGVTTATFESEPFTVDAGGALAGDRIPLPDGAFFRDAMIDADGVPQVIQATSAREGVADPVGVLLRNVRDKPADGWSGRTVLYFVAVAADPVQRGGTRAVPVVVFTREATTLGTAASGGATPTTPVEVLRLVAEREEAAMAWVQNYTVYQRVEMFEIPIYFERVNPGRSTGGDSGGGDPAGSMPTPPGGKDGFRTVPPTIYTEEWYEQAGVPAPRHTEEQAQSLELLGQALDSGLRSEGMAALGDAAVMMTSLMAAYVRVGASIDPEDLMVEDTDGRAAAAREFARRARLVGTETIDGRSAYHLLADGLGDIELPSDDEVRYTMRSSSMWVDAEHYVPLRLTTDVDAHHGREVRPVTIELLNQNLAQLTTGDGTTVGAIFPTRVVMRIKGLTEALSEKDRKDLEKSAAELAKLKSEIANMPKAVQGMMQSQIDRMEKMMGTGDGGSIAEAVIDVLHVAANEGPPYPGGVGDFAMPGARVEGAMVVAEFPELEDLSERQGSIFQYPVSLEFSGAQENGRMASISIRDIVEHNPAVKPFGTYEDGRSSSATSKRLDGVARGTYEKPDGQMGEIEEHPAEITVTHWSVSEVRGYVSSRDISAHFIVGHMPCSSKPRAITPAELERARADPYRPDLDTREEFVEEVLEFENECPIHPYLLIRGIE